MKIIYWSGTGNTEAMANLILKGIKEEGGNAEILNISSNNIDSLKDDEVIVLGCPSMGQEELEDGEFIPFLEKVESDLKGKQVALFGSYGWGSGEWMDSFEERVKSSGASVPLRPVIVNYAPDGESELECIKYGRSIAKLNK
ncbi:flavodoxin, short chain [Clostridium collagenovorans DSM 3089]|uniref:Flavodoxin n=1 Tax=Clostridium collagenovorans DSM 3089 TaxID=1121306 RepID=A0A1M5YF97_9CLOT|nr:flavodoxin [Clostridium collagenovorans]SHI10715.1 flavodoxin, short chain [Clostridium collagenovorans DSM 3089]